MGGIVQDTLGTLGIGETRAEETAGQAAATQREVLARLEAIDIPDIEKQKIKLAIAEAPEKLVPFISEMLPQLEASAFEQITLPEELKASQQKALSEIEARAEMGLTPEEEQIFRDLQRKSQAEGTAQQNTIMQNLAARGMSGGGQELALRQAAAQQQQNAMADASGELAAQSFSVKMGALDRLGSLASQMRGEEYGEQSDLAKSRDIINQFNTQQKINQEQQRQDLINQSRQYNLGQSEAYKQQQAATQNQEQMHNTGLQQQQFQNQMAKAGATGGALSNIANTQMEQSKAQQAGFGQMVGGGALLGMGLGGVTNEALIKSVPALAKGWDSDINLKQNISKGDESIQDLLDKIDAYDFNYKTDTGLPQDRKTGVMAQDLEKSELGEKMVIDTPEGKMVSYAESAPITLAGLGNLNKRLKKIEKMLKGE